MVLLGSLGGLPVFIRTQCLRIGPAMRRFLGRQGHPTGTHWSIDGHVPARQGPRIPFRGGERATALGKSELEGSLSRSGDQVCLIGTSGRNKELIESALEGKLSQH